MDNNAFTKEQWESVASSARPLNLNSFGASVVKGFSTAWKTKALADIVLILGKQKISAHKTVLIIWSETFRAMLSENWAEGSMSELTIHVNPEEYENFIGMLEYMYKGDYSWVNEGNIVSVISLANYYGVISLKEACGALLGEQVAESNILSLLDLADNFDCRSLAAKCGEYLGENFAGLLGTPEGTARLMSLSPSVWEGMVKSDDIKVKSEKQLFQTVVEYANQFKDEEGKRDAILELLLPHIRYTYLPVQYLVEEVETDSTLSHLVFLQKMLHETYRVKIVSGAKISFDRKPRKASELVWDTNRKGGSVNLESENKVASMRGTSGWQGGGCMTERGFSSGSHYWEIRIDHSTDDMIGVARSDCNITTNSVYSSDAQHVQFMHYSDTYLYGATTGTSLGGNFVTGDTVGMLLTFALDGKSATLEFYKNKGKVGQVVISGLSGNNSNNPILLHPAVELYTTPAKVTLLTYERRE